MSDSIRTVLIDDTPDIRLLLRLALSRSDGYSVVAEAGDGAVGVELVNRYQPDLVLLDLAMPVMDGLEALPHIREVSPGSRVIVLSGFESARMQQAAMSAGAVGYIQKGQPVPQLLAAINELARPDGARPTPAPVSAGAATVHAASDIAELRSAMAVAAHEMRNGVHVILGFTELLRSMRHELPEPKVSSMLDSILLQARVLDQQTNDLSAASKLQRAALTVDMRPVDVTAAIEAAVALLPDPGRVLVSAPAGENAHADPVRLHQILINLLTNAEKYTDGPVRVVVRPSGAELEIDVVDEGPGVPDSFQERLFTPYARADGIATGGTGLGLYVVKGLAEAQGGRVWFTATPGGGATFSFTLARAALL